MGRSLSLILAGLALFLVHSSLAQRYLELADEGDSLFAAGRAPEALLAYERSFNLRETSRGAYGIAECLSSMLLAPDTTWYRSALVLAKHEYARAKKAIDKWDALYRMAYCHQRLGEHEQASRWFGNIACDHRHAHIEIAKSLMALGRYEEALSTLLHCVERYPEESQTLIHECDKALGH